MATQRVGGVVRTAANWHTPEFLPLTTGEEATNLLARALFRDQPRRVELRLVDRYAPLVQIVRDTAKGSRVLTRTYLRSPYLDVQGDWDTYVRSRSANYRSSHSRGLKRLERDGTIEFRVLEGEAISARLPEALAVEASGWKGRRGTAIQSKPETLQFYRDVVLWATARGSARLAVLDIDDRMAAFVLGLQEDTTFFELKTGFDDAHSHGRPGAVLHHLLLERLFGVGTTRYEFLGGYDRWKLSLASGVHERALVQAFAPTLTGVVDWTAIRYGRPIAGRIRTKAHALGGRQT